MGRRLNTTVIVQPKPGSGDAGFLVLGPDDDVPEWAADQIGDHAWEADDTAGPPPKAGKGSSKEAWVEYATAHGVELDPEATRDAIIAALEAAGIPTE